jgi:hypothetical protein
MTFNYVLANIDDRHTIINGTTIAIDDDYLDIYMMRFQVDF